MAAVAVMVNRMCAATVRGYNEKKGEPVPLLTCARGDAIKCGKLLLRAKKKKKDAGHGNWEGLFVPPNLQSDSAENWRFGFSKQKAWNYMRAAKNPNQRLLNIVTRYVNAARRIGEISLELEKAEIINDKKGHRVPTSGKPVKRQTLSESGITTSTANRI